LFVVYLRFYIGIFINLMPLKTQIMKKKNNFNLEDLMIIMIESFQGLVEVLKERHLIPTTPDDSDYRDAADTKQKLNVSDSTLYRWRKEGIIDYQIKKGKIYYDIASVLRKRN